MKVVLIGYGKMGKTIEKVAPDMGVQVIASVTHSSKSAEWQKIQSADVCIDFSHPDAVIENIEQVGKYKKPLVVGTTGWYDEIKTVKKCVQKYQIGLIYAQNFSLGMSLFINIVKEAAKLVNAFDNYDVAITEIHHNEKVDAPSGTALSIAKELLDNIERKKTFFSNSRPERVSEEQLQIASVRVGSVNGTHSVIFNSEQDTITLTHQSHTKEAWAKGALHAAKWIRGKYGLFNIKDMLET